MCLPANAESSLFPDQTSFIFMSIPVTKLENVGLLRMCFEQTIPFQLMGVNRSIILTKTIGRESKPFSKKFKVKTRTQRVNISVNKEVFYE